MKYLIVLASFICALMGNSIAFAEKRVALVIGNGAYQFVNKLPNPANDAKALSAVLQSAGFEVINGVDLKRDEMVSRVAQFGDSVRNGVDAAIIFYAGHGVQIAGKNYLIPVDANLRSAFDVKANAIDAEDLLDNASGARVKLVLLDACRDNPFAEQMSKGDAKTRSVAGNSGLAAMQSAEGTMISFATSPGAAALDGEGEHSPFSRALINNLATPGLEINEAMTNVRAEVQTVTQKKQLPWANTNMTGKFFMVPLATPAAPSAPSATALIAPAVGMSDAQAVETAFWQSAQASGRREEYLLYLSKYPKGKGQYSELAELRVATLEKGSSPSPTATDAAPAALKLDTTALKNEDANKATEDALSLDRTKWLGMQAKLSALGFGTGGVDGDPGDATRRAISKWQTARSYKVSGYFNKVQMDALLGEVAPTVAQVPSQVYTRSAAPVARQPQRAYAGHSSGLAGPGQVLQGIGHGIGVGIGHAFGCKLMGC